MRTGARQSRPHGADGHSEGGGRRCVIHLGKHTRRYDLLLGLRQIPHCLKNRGHASFGVHAIGNSVGQIVQAFVGSPTPLGFGPSGRRTESASHEVRGCANQPWRSGPALKDQGLPGPPDLKEHRGCQVLSGIPRCGPSEAVVVDEVAVTPEDLRECISVSSHAPVPQRLVQNGRIDQFHTPLWAPGPERFHLPRSVLMIGVSRHYEGATGAWWALGTVGLTRHGGSHRPGRRR